ncbi:MAG: nucleoside hydrolase [Erysipelotrichaceae bacterium]|jgi:inosine-uridine nucleoside N-ribohydrolase|nr:nucleoside hydrolase [Erysipelotrichaceae bacterium]
MNIIIDCDPGVDDALAILTAAKQPELNILAITSVSGNLPGEITYKNAKLLAQAAGLSCPVGRGADQPLVKEARNAGVTHGSDGLGGHAIELAAYEKPYEVLDAVEVLKEQLLASDEKVVLVVLGPMTNIALLFQKYPEVKDKIEKISFMGGSLCGGNANTYGEFNIYVDPEAAGIVIESGIPMIMAGLDVTLKAFVTKDDLKVWEDLGNPIAAFAAHCCLHYGSHDPALHDPCSILVLTHPELFTTMLGKLSVCCDEGDHRGETYLNPVSKSDICTILQNVDRKAFIGHITEALKQY